MIIMAWLCLGLTLRCIELRYDGLFVWCVLIIKINRKVGSEKERRDKEY